MDKNMENNRKIISIALIIMAVIIIITMAVNILSNRNLINSQNNNTEQNLPNYVATLEGSKINISEGVVTDKKVGNILLERSQIVYLNGTSKLTSKVTNDNVVKDNLRFKIKFIANDGSIISESVGYVGSIKENETKYIDSYITADVSNSKNLVYEIME